MRVLVIANPAAGRGRPFRRLSRHLAKGRLAGLEVELALSRTAGEAAELARRAAADPPDALAVCGGDGTVNEVASAVPDPPFPVAVLPAGTQNLLAKELGLASDPVAALQSLPACRVRRVDLGLIEGSSRRVFLVMAGIGFDAFVAASVSTAAKMRLGTAAYYFAVCRALGSFPLRRFTVESGEGVVSCSSCVVSNAKAYGGGLALNRAADMSDGLLDVLTFAADRRTGYLRFLLAARLGLGLRFEGVGRFRSRHARIDGPPGVPVQADGEVCGQLPVVVTLRPASYPLLVPAGP